jgi:hypothetical protein
MPVKCGPWLAGKPRATTLVALVYTAVRILSWMLDFHSREIISFLESLNWKVLHVLERKLWSIKSSCWRFYPLRIQQYFNSPWNLSNTALDIYTKCEILPLRSLYEIPWKLLSDNLVLRNPLWFGISH